MALKKIIGTVEQESTVLPKNISGGPGVPLAELMPGFDSLIVMVKDSRNVDIVKSAIAEAGKHLGVDGMAIVSTPPTETSSRGRKPNSFFVKGATSAIVHALELNTLVQGYAPVASQTVPELATYRPSLKL